MCDTCSMSKGGPRDIKFSLERGLRKMSRKIKVGRTSVGDVVAACKDRRASRLEKNSSKKAENENPFEEWWKSEHANWTL